MERVGAGMTEASEGISRMDGAFDVSERRGICEGVMGNLSRGGF